MISLKLDWIKSNVLVADINPVYGCWTGGCFLALLFNTDPHSKSCREDSIRAVILQLRATQLLTAALHLYGIDVSY